MKRFTIILAVIVVTVMAYGKHYSSVNSHGKKICQIVKP